MKVFESFNVVDTQYWELGKRKFSRKGIELAWKDSTITNETWLTEATMQGANQKFLQKRFSAVGDEMG